MKSFFDNVYELLALLFGSTELKQSISVPSESVVTLYVYHLENVMENICGVSNHLTCEIKLLIMIGGFRSSA